ncbi:hypothetical protein ACEPAH_6540 [Sanghuangporus vaninii]
MWSTIYSRACCPSATTPSSSCSTLNTLNTPSESPLASRFVPRLLSKASSSSSLLLRWEGHPGKETNSYPFPAITAQSSRAPSFVSRTSACNYDQIVANKSAEGADATLRNTEFGAPDVFVTAVDAENASRDPIVLRSYNVGSESEIAFTHRIVDTARATTAAPAYFSAKTLGNGKVAIDGGLSVNNPTDVLISEARRKYGRSVCFELFLSIGLLCPSVHLLLHSSRSRRPLAMPSLTLRGSICASRSDSEKAISRHISTSMCQRLVMCASMFTRRFQLSLVN